MSRKNDFSAKTKNILAGRAGYQCSHPQCGIITIGPGDDLESVSSIGEAAHIYSASINGPRGQGSLSDEELKSIENGFWACKNHARLIDTNKGEGFSAEQLKSWKDLHETKIKLHQGRIQRKLYWLNSLKVNECSVFLDNQEIFFGKVTFIYGPKNSSGKSTIFNFINSLSSFESLEGRINAKQSFCYELQLFNPDANLFFVKSNRGKITSKLNNEKVHFNPMSIEIFRYDLNFLRQFYQDDRDDQDKLTDYFGIDKVKLKSLLSSIGTSKYSKISHAYIEFQGTDGDEEYPEGFYLCVQLKGNDFVLNFSSLSDGERSIVLIEILSELIQTYAKYKQSVLLLNLQSTSFDQVTTGNLLKFLMSSDIDFQTIITSLIEPTCKEIKLLNYYVLNGSVNDVKILPRKW